MNLYRLEHMVQIIQEDEGLSPLTLSDIMEHDGEYVFVIGDICGYGTIDVENMVILVDDKTISISDCGNKFFAYIIRPSTVC